MDEITDICNVSSAEVDGDYCDVNCTHLRWLCNHVPLSLDINYYDNLTNSSSTNSTKTITDAEAYGYGFLMIFVISMMSLLGVAIVPFVRRNSKLAVCYKYIIILLISMGVAALITDALLHLIPNAIGISIHHDHSQDEGIDEREVIWKMCGVLAGVASFFMLELLLHACSSRLGHTHSHGVAAVLDSIKVSEDTATLIRDDNHRSLSNSHGNNKSISHRNHYEQDYGTVHNDQEEENNDRSCLRALTNIKPLAWVIILGDAMHNLTDGLAVGVAISQSLGLGLSTAIAILFHEIPHELSDYAILLHTGMSWYKALFLNFLSALTSLVGFFIGVAIGTESEKSNAWLLVVIAGQFLYIALAVLLPEVLHSQEKGWPRVIEIIMIFIGFALGFSILLVIALFEHDINVIIQ